MVSDVARTNFRRCVIIPSWLGVGRGALSGGGLDVLSQLLLIFPYEVVDTKTKTICKCGQD
jgi:hypothetical protein